MSRHWTGLCPLVRSEDTFPPTPSFPPDHMVGPVKGLISNCLGPAWLLGAGSHPKPGGLVLYNLLLVLLKQVSF